MRSVNTRRGQLWYTAKAPHPQTDLHGQPCQGRTWRRRTQLPRLSIISSDGNVMAVDVNISGVFRAGIPKPLFKLPAGARFVERFAGLQAVSDVCSLKHGRTLTTSVQPCGEPAIAPAEMTPGTKLGRYEILASACRNQILARTVRS